MNEASYMAAPERSVPGSSDERSGGLAATLGRMKPVLETAIGTDSPLVVRLEELRHRLEHERLQLAVLGQFKRGKSTFINALLGADVLPTGVIPLTAVANRPYPPNG
jgi:ribosome biogenesis GTPase A